jgi:hypothetical protein
LIRTQAYVSGVVATLENKEHFDKIWHDGYDRGTEVQMLAYKAEQDQTKIKQLKEDLNLKNPLEK